MTEAGYHRRRPRRLVGSCRAANLPAAASPGLHEVLLAYYLSEYESWESGVARTSCMPPYVAQPFLLEGDGQIIAEGLHRFLGGIRIMNWLCHSVSNNPSPGAI